MLLMPSRGPHPRAGTRIGSSYQLSSLVRWALRVLLRVCSCRMSVASAPAFQELFGGAFRQLLPELSQFLLEVVRDGQRFVPLQSCEQPGQFVELVRLREVLGVLQQQPADPLEHVAMQLVLQFVVQVAAPRRQFFVHELDHMPRFIEQPGRTPNAPWADASSPPRCTRPPCRWPRP